MTERAEENRRIWQVWLGHFWSVLREVLTEIREDRVLSVAGGVTFYSVLAMVPAISALVSLFGLVTDPADATEIFVTASTVLPGEAAQLLTEQAVRIASKARGTLTLTAVVALVLALWSANGGTRAMIEALGIARNETETRGFIHRNLLALGFTLGALVVLIILSVGMAALPTVLAWFGLGRMTEVIVLFGRLPLIMVLLMVALAILYRWGPPRADGATGWLSPGVVLASAALVLGSLGFGWYVGSFGSYDETYGSLSAVAVTMIWIWLSTVVVLVGAELDVVLERRARLTAP